MDRFWDRALVVLLPPHLGLFVRYVFVILVVVPVGRASCECIHSMMFGTGKILDTGPSDSSRR